MPIEKHYFLSVGLEDLKTYSEQLNLLKGYVATKICMKIDPDHGPVDPEAEILNECYPILKELTESLSNKLALINHGKIIQARKEMAEDIMRVLTNNHSGIDMLTKLQQTLDKYEIIGKRQFTRGRDEDDIPF